MASGAAARFGVEPLSIVITRKQPQLFVRRLIRRPRGLAHVPAAKALRFVVLSLRGPSLGWRRALPGKGPARGIRQELLTIPNIESKRSYT